MSGRSSPADDSPQSMSDRRGSRDEEHGVRNARKDLQGEGLLKAGDNLTLKQIATKMAAAPTDTVTRGRVAPNSLQISKPGLTVPDKSAGKAASGSDSQTPKKSAARADKLASEPAYKQGTFEAPKTSFTLHDGHAVAPAIDQIPARTITVDTKRDPTSGKHEVTKVSLELLHVTKVPQPDDPAKPKQRNAQIILGGRTDSAGKITTDFAVDLQRGPTGEIVKARLSRPNNFKVAGEVQASGFTGKYWKPGEGKMNFVEYDNTDGQPKMTYSYTPNIPAGGMGKLLGKHIAGVAERDLETKVETKPIPPAEFKNFTNWLEDLKIKAFPPDEVASTSRSVNS